MLSYFWVSGVINSMLSLYPKQSSEQKAELLFNTFFLLLLLGAFSALGLVIFSQLPLPFNIPFEPVIGIAVFILANSLSYLIEYILFLQEKKRWLFTYGIVNAVITIGVILLLTYNYLHHDGFKIITSYQAATFSVQIAVAMCSIAVLKILLLFFLLKKYASFKINPALLKLSLFTALPLVLSILISGSSEYVDGLIVNSKFPSSVFAIYRYGAKELPIMLIIANTFSVAMLPSIAENLSNGMEAIKTKSLRMMHVFFPATICLMFISPWAFTTFFNSGFIFSALIFNIYLLLIIPRLVFPQTILIGMQQSKYQLISSVIEICINISASIFLASKIGILGVAVGTLIAFSFDKIFLITVNYFKFKLHPTQYIRIDWYLFYSILTVIAFILSYTILYEL